ncbi:hypothetical protein BC831DRAFT_137576 [Entophlyctis helioformis]|nr:hypothetical protein BC831DRAFT_137576 [Entophlyctis helioformis]
MACQSVAQAKSRVHRRVGARPTYAFSKLGVVGSNKQGQVALQTGNADRLVVALLVHLLAKQNVLAQREVDDPGFLRHVRRGAVQLHLGAADLANLAEERSNERRLARADIADNGDALALGDRQRDVGSVGLVPSAPSHLKSASLMSKARLQPAGGLDTGSSSTSCSWRNSSRREMAVRAPAYERTAMGSMKNG